MVSRGTRRRPNDRGQWTGRRDAGRSHREAARNAGEMADETDDRRLDMQWAILAAVAYGGALKTKGDGIRRESDQQRLPATVRHPLGSAAAAELTCLTRLLAHQDDSAYGHRFIPTRDARRP